MVRAEYAGDRSLAEIADIWGRWEGMASAQVDAMEPFERWLRAEGLLRLADESSEIGDVVRG
jgi:hypothetical protein